MERSLVQRAVDPWHPQATSVFLNDSMPTPLLSAIAPYFKPYVDLMALSGGVYYFRKTSTALKDQEGKPRNWHPGVAHVMLREYHSANEGILYAAFPRAADVSNLLEDDLLYLGCSGSGGSRYWRGRPSEVARFPSSRCCFHHEQMRRGRDANNLESYLAQEGPVRIHTLTDTDVGVLCSKHGLILPDGKYPSHQLEKKILAEGFRLWKWNRRA